MKLVKSLALTGVLLMGGTVASTVLESPLQLQVSAKTTDKVVSKVTTTTETTEKLKGTNTTYKVVTVKETVKYKSGKTVITTTETKTPIKNGTSSNTITNTTTTTTGSSDTVKVYDFSKKYLGKGQLPNYSKQNISKSVQKKINSQLQGFWKEAGANLKADYDQKNKKVNNKKKFTMAGKSEITYRQNNTVSVMGTILSKDVNGKAVETYMTITYNTKTGNQLNIKHMFKNDKEFNKYNKVYQKHMKKKYSAEMDLKYVVWYFNKTGQLIVRATPNDTNKIKKYLDIVVPNQYLLEV